MCVAAFVFHVHVYMWNRRNVSDETTISATLLVLHHADRLEIKFLYQPVYLQTWKSLFGNLILYCDSQ